MRLLDMWIDFVNLRSEEYAENSRIPSKVYNYSVINLLVLDRFTCSAVLYYKFASYVLFCSEFLLIGFLFFFWVHFILIFNYMIKIQDV